jgi:hypothetical protein
MVVSRMVGVVAMMVVIVAVMVAVVAIKIRVFRGWRVSSSGRDGAGQKLAYGYFEMSRGDERQPRFT